MLGGSDKAECAIEFVVVVRGFSEYMVLCHVVGDRVHSLFGECEASYGIVYVFRGNSEFVEYRCNPVGPTGVVDNTIGKNGQCVLSIVGVVVAEWLLSVVRDGCMSGEFLLPSESSAPKLVVKLIRKVMVGVCAVNA